MDHKTVVRFASLFWGRTDVWYEDTSRATWGHVNLKLFHEHLLGLRMIGTYPITDEGLVKWGCIDIDDGDLAKAITVQASWQEYGIISWIERSKSKGYHVWVFSDWIPAETMRRAGLLILWDSYMDPKTEVNPKQYQLWTEPRPKNSPSWVTHGIGNTVRLPYSPMATEGRMVVVSATGLSRPRLAPLALIPFLDVAEASRAPHRRLRAVADRHRALEAHQAHIRASRVNDSNSSGIIGPKGPFQRQDAWDILEGTKTFDSMRDNQFYTLIQLMHSDRVGYDYGQAEAACRRIYERQLTNHADFSWKQVEDKLRRTYS